MLLIGTDLDIRDLINSMGGPVHVYMVKDYPLVIKNVCTSKEFATKILVCKTGIGMCIAANRLKGIRAVNGTSPEIIIKARKRNNANVLCLGYELLTIEEMVTFIRLFQDTPYDGESNEKLRLIEELT